MNRSTPGLPVHHQLPEFTQTHVHRVRDAIQPSHPLSSPSPTAPSSSQHQSPFQWVNSSHEVAKVLEFQLQPHSLQRNPRVDLLQNGLVGSPCSPGDSQESSPTPQFKSINSLALVMFKILCNHHYYLFTKLFCLQSFWLCFRAHRILVPQPRIEPMPLHCQRSLNHRTTRKVLQNFITPNRNSVPIYIPKPLVPSVSRNFIQVESYRVCPFVPGLPDLAQCSQASSTLSCVSEPYQPIVNLGPVHGGTTFCSPSHWWDTWAVSTFSLLWLTLQWTLSHKCLFKCLLPVLSGIHLGVELLGHTTDSFFIV